MLDDLTRIENDVRCSIKVTFGTTLADTGSSLIKAAPWLKFVTGPASDYVKATNQALLKSYLEQAEKRVVTCDRSCKIKGTVPAKPGSISVSGQACSLKRPFKAKTGASSSAPSSSTPPRTRGHLGLPGQGQQRTLRGRRLGFLHGHPQRRPDIGDAPLWLRGDHPHPEGR